jgi:hypothetical protein
MTQRLQGDDSPGEGELHDQIAPDLMKVLERSKYFERLDEVLSPSDGSPPNVACDHTFRLTRTILAELDFDEAATEVVVGVLHSRGACCDCEVLYNVAETSRWKAQYWRSKVKEDIEAKDSRSSQEGSSLTPPKAADKF